MENNQDDLFTQIQNGNTNAFEKLYFNMQPRLFGFSKKFIDDSEVARDIIQEIFFEFWENRQTIIIKTSVNAYLFRMLHNKCLNYIRNKKVHDKYASYVDIKLKEAELLFFDHDQENYKSIFFKEIEDIFRTSVENLPGSCREILVLSRMIGLSNKEIADQLSVSVRTIENQIYRALKILKVKLKDYLFLFPFLF
jgi:RNA polymerase sigma-70 factor (ECF subfamily)